METDEEKKHCSTPSKAPSFMLIISRAICSEVTFRRDVLCNRGRCRRTRHKLTYDPLVHSVTLAVSHLAADPLAHGRLPHQVSYRATSRSTDGPTRNQKWF